MDLLTLSREHDLPPRWDGHPVTWDGWHDTPRAFICPLPRGRSRCTACGSSAQCTMNRGVIHPLPDETFDVQRVKRTKSGREYTVTRQAQAWPIVALVAFRCPDCRHDTVFDSRTDEWWDLDHTDYGPDGSYPPGGSDG